jgi:hypothetical protein
MDINWDYMLDPPDWMVSNQPVDEMDPEELSYRDSREASRAEAEENGETYDESDYLEDVNW